MYVIICFMKSASYIDKDSLRCWYLWSSKLCCSKESDQDEISLDKSEETRNKILLSAFNEIYQRGFQAASINNILKDTGITKGGLYYHFENKQELGYSVLDEVIRDTIQSVWIGPLKSTNDPISVLKKVIEESGNQITTEDVRLGCPLNNLAQEMSPVDDGFRDRIAAIYQDWQETIEAACKRGQAAGNVDSSIDSKEISLLFIASLQGCMGFAKSVQNVDTLMSCGQGLIDRLESLRPLK